MALCLSVVKAAGVSRPHWCHILLTTDTVSQRLHFPLQIFGQSAAQCQRSLNPSVKSQLNHNIYLIFCVSRRKTSHYWLSDTHTQFHLRDLEVISSSTKFPFRRQSQQNNTSSSVMSRKSRNQVKATLWLWSQKSVLPSCLRSITLTALIPWGKLGIKNTCCYFLKT